MASVEVIGKGNAKANSIELADSVFAREYNEALVHQVVSAYIHNGHTGTKKQKNRSEVRGGGRKPWRQKGTGNARAGTRSSPIWRKGGCTFAARPHVSTVKVNKKMYRAALCTILSELLRQQRLVVIEALTLADAKTKLLVSQLKELALENVCIVTDELDNNLYLAARNLLHVHVVTVENADPVTFVRFEKVLMTKAALKRFEEMLG